jgi:general secretion pathway protein G
MIGKKSGFSLFEMLIVVAIIGAIALAAVPVAEISYVKAQETQLESNQEAIRQAILIWKRDCRNVVITQYGYDGLFNVPDSQLYPPTLEALVRPVPPYAIEDRTTAVVANFYPKPYLNAIPGDPFVGAAEWSVYSASGTDVGTYSAGITTLPANHVGVMDISCTPDPTKRRGFVTGIDGTKYTDW